MEKQALFLEKIVADAKGKEKHIYSGPSFYSEQLSRIADASFVEGVRAYYERTDGFFSAIEQLRINLAKHEVPRTKRMVSEMPGYSRIDQISGTLYWHYTS